MRAARVRTPGPPEALRYEVVPDPVPGPGEALIRMQVMGVNYVDVYHRSGEFTLSPPYIPGIEGAGVVEAVGEGVTFVQPGDRVAHDVAVGAYAELQSVPAEKVVKLPPTVDARTAAAVLVQGLTAHYLTHSTFALAPGHTALVLAAAGGVGRMLIQMAKRAGARAIGAVGSDAKVEIARAVGADDVIVYRGMKFACAVRELTGGAGVDVVYDGVGKTTFHASLDSLKPRGLLAVYGLASGQAPELSPRLLSEKGSLYLTWSGMRDYRRTRAEFDQRVRDVLTWAADGSLDIKIHGEYPLAAAAAAHRALESRESSGKLLLIP